MQIFPLIYTNELDCVTSPIISMISSKKLDYKLAFAQCWGFSFKEEDPIFPGSLGPRIGEGYSNVLECLNKYYNIKFNVYNDTKPDEVYNIIKESISKELPVVIYTNLYNCVWSKLYKREYTQHGCMVVDLDDNGDLFCVDAAPLCYGAVMKLGDFNESCNGCITIGLDEYNNSNIEWQAVLNDVMGKLYNGDTFSSLASFINKFETDYNLEAELQTSFGNGVDSAHINWKLLRISGGRKLFGQFLKSMGEKYQVKELISLSNELVLISDKWKENRNLIAKHMYNPDRTDILEEAIYNFKLLLELEKQTAKNILDFSSGSQK